jgi:uncharacterized protein YycO
MIKIKKGDILIFETNNTFISRLTKLFVGKYTHVAVALNKHIMIEAHHFGGVRIRRIDNKRNFNIARVSKVKIFDELKFEEDLCESINTHYSFRTYFNIGLSKIFSFVKRKDYSGLICTELIADALEKQGVFVDYDKQSHELLPEDFLNSKDLEII